MNTCPHCQQKHAAVNHFCPVTGLPIALGPRLLSTKLLDKYTVLKIIGEGPIGIILEVEDSISKNHYAAKLIHPQFTRDTNASKRLMEDAARVQALSCDHIAEIIQVGRDAGAAIVVIRELMIGECLADRIAKVGRFSLTAAATVTREILIALSAIHQASVINLDLSPEDIFLVATQSGSKAKMVDIGERHVKQSMPPDSKRPESYNYYAPEQLDRSRQPNLRSDIYAAGMILYEMLTGVVPSGTPAPLDTFRQDIPPDLSNITMKAIAPTPNNRFQSSAEFLHALDSINWESPKLAPQTQVSVSKVSAAGTAPYASLQSATPAGTAIRQPDPETASVIVEMPEIAKPFPIKIFIGIAVSLLLGGAALWYFALGGDKLMSGKNAAVQQVQITVNVTPPDAAVYVDGTRLSGIPPILSVPMDSALHTIAGKADGYEPIERDVSFDRSKTVKLELMEIIQPDEPSTLGGEIAPSAAPAEVIDTNAVPNEVKTAPVPTIAEPKKDIASKTTKIADKPIVKTNKSNIEKSKKAKKQTPEKTPKPPKPEKSPASKTEPKSKNVEGFRTTNPFE